MRNFLQHIATYILTKFLTKIAPIGFIVGWSEKGQENLGVRGRNVYSDPQELLR